MGTEKGRQLPGLSSLWGPAVKVLESGSLLLLILSLGLARAQETPEDVPVQPGFDTQKVEGRWLTVQLAASHAPLAAPDDPLRLALHSIWSRGEDVELVLFWTGEGVCQGLNVTVHPTGLLGQYQSASRRMLEDPRWLGQYLEYVSKFHLQEAPVFNLDDQCPPPAASAGATP
nr:beta-lactoglobulin isoform X2 [Vicugna pacos]